MTKLTQRKKFEVFIGIHGSHGLTVHHGVELISSGYCSSSRNLRAHNFSNQQKKTEGTEYRTKYSKPGPGDIFTPVRPQIINMTAAQRTCVSNPHQWHVPPPVNHPETTVLLLVVRPSATSSCLNKGFKCVSILEVQNFILGMERWLSH